MGLTARVARALGDRRQRGKVRHEVVTMVRQRVHAVALGYEDLNDHDTLRADPVVQTACDRDESLASSSTLCRFERPRSINGRLRFTRNCSSSSLPFAHPPEELVLDFDATDDPVHAPAGTIFSRVLRQLLLPSVVRVVRPAVAGGLPSALEHRCIETCLADIVVVGQTVAKGMAGCSYRVSGRLGVLPAPDARLV